MALPEINWRSILPTDSARVLREKLVRWDSVLHALFATLKEVETSTTPEDWIAVSYLNSWVDFAAGYQGVEYRLVGDLVQVRGTCKSGTPGATNPIFTLPAGYRPPARHRFAGVINGAVAAEVDVKATGDVVVVHGTATSVSLEFQFSINS